MKELEKIREALREMVYETTHLSPMRNDGSHECTISAEALAHARAALSAIDALIAESGDKDEWLVWSNEHRAWWGSNRCGYTDLLSNAGVYTREEAIRIAAGASGGWLPDFPPTEIPVQRSAALACLPPPPCAGGK